MSANQSAPTTIDAYLATFPPEVQALLQQIRQVIHKAVPNLGETISYGMPTFTLNGKYLVYIAAHKSISGCIRPQQALKSFKRRWRCMEGVRAR